MERHRIMSSCIRIWKQLALFDDIKYIKQYYEMFTVDRCTCSYGGCTCKKNGFYSRSLRIISHGTIEDTVVRIPRIKCKSCGKTSGIMSDNVMPFSGYSIKMLIKVIMVYLVHKSTVSEIADEFQISPMTIYRWKKEISLLVQKNINNINNVLWSAVVAIKRIFFAENIATTYGNGQTHLRC